MLARDSTAILLCRNDVPVEYAGEEQAICAVGLTKPKGGVFVAAVQHILILCTTVEVGSMLRPLHAPVLAGQQEAHDLKLADSH